MVKNNVNPTKQITGYPHSPMPLKRYKDNHTHTLSLTPPGPNKHTGYMTTNTKYLIQFNLMYDRLESTL